jgi:NitT/TauT family transport system permease protein
MFSFVLDFFRSTPVTTLYPVFVLIFGIKHLSKVAMVAWGCFFVIALNAAYGAMQAGTIRSQMARLYGASSFQIFRWITLFGALPQIIIGLRVALSYALIIEVLCEMFMGSQYGLGQRVTEAYTTYAIERLYAIILLVGTIGYALNRLFVFFEKRLASWVTT